MLIAWNIQGAPIAMIGWLTLKMITNWNRPGQERDDRQVGAAFAALLAGLLSMFFAAAGGVICRGRPPGP